MTDYDGHTIDVGHVHTLTAPDGPCRDDCPHPDHHFTCERCEGVFRKGWTDEEANAESVENFGTLPADDRALICDPCYNEFMVWWDANEIAPSPDIPDALRADIHAEIAKGFGVPMDVIDGRPWVRTHDEAHDPIIWGNGTDDHGIPGCGHPDCDNTAGRNLTGILSDADVMRIAGEQADRWADTLARLGDGPAPDAPHEITTQPPGED